MEKAKAKRKTKKVHLSHREENTRCIPRKASASVCWKPAHEWRDMVRKGIGEKIEWNLIESNRSGFVSLTGSCVLEEMTKFVYETNGIFDPLRIGLIHVKEDPYTMSVNQYINVMAKPVNKIMRTDKNRYELSVSMEKKDIRFGINVDVKNDFIERLALPVIIYLEKLMDEFTYKHPSVVSKMVELNVTYSQIERLVAWSISYLSYALDIHIDFHHDSYLELEHGLDNKDCNEEMKKVIDIIANNKDVEDDMYSFLQENGIDMGFTSLLDYDNGSNFNEVVKDYYTSIEVINRVAKHEMKMMSFLINLIDKEFTMKNFKRVGLWLARRLSYVSENLPQSSENIKLLNHLIKGILSIATEDQVLVYIKGIAERELDEKSAGVFNDFRMRMQGLYSIQFTSTFYTQWRNIKIERNIWNDGLDLFEDIEHPGYTIERLGGSYEKIPTKMYFQLCWDHARFIDKNTYPFMHDLINLFKQ